MEWPGSLGASLCDVYVIPMGAAVWAPIAGKIIVVVPVLVFTMGSTLPDAKVIVDELGAGAILKQEPWKRVQKEIFLQAETHIQTN